MAALAAYRDLVRSTGPWFLILSFLARLPVATGQLGTLTLMVATGHSYGVSGLTTGAIAAGMALGGPVVGGLADRYGQRRVGLVSAAVDAIAYAALVAAALLGAPVVALVAAAVLAGAATPQVGPLVRVRWAALLRQRHRDDLYGTALSYESVIDELSFVAGPVVVGLLALTGAPAAPVLVTAGLLAAFGVGFALHRTAASRLTARAPGSGGPARAGNGLPRLDLAILFAAMACVGVIFGATQTGVTALAGATGRADLAGLVYAGLGLASAVGGLITAALPARFPITARYLVFAVALCAGAAAALLVGSLIGAVVAMAVVGFTIAPYMIVVYGLAERITPQRRAAAAMTVVASGVVLGVAAGAAVAGRLADLYGHRGAFVVPVLAGGLAVLLALLATPRLAGRLRIVARPA